MINNWLYCVNVYNNIYILAASYIIAMYPLFNEV